MSCCRALVQPVAWLTTEQSTNVAGMPEFRARVVQDERLQGFSEAGNFSRKLAVMPVVVRLPDGHQR